METLENRSLVDSLGEIVNRAAADERLNRLRERNSLSIVANSQEEIHTLLLELHAPAYITRAVRENIAETDARIADLGAEDA